MTPLSLLKEDFELPFEKLNVRCGGISHSEAWMSDELGYSFCMDSWMHSCVCVCARASTLLLLAVLLGLFISGITNREIAICF